MLESGRRLIIGQSAVLVQEVIAEILVAQELQVHRQKRGVVDAVDIPQLVVELEAVQQRRSLR